jgi:hypothetical protein
MADFLPEYSQMPVGDRYRPLFRLFAGEGWRYVRKDGRPVECATISQAISEAKDCVRRILNPEIRVEHIEAVANDALADEVQAFLAKREQEAEAEREKVFGGIVRSVIHMRGGRQVQVETIKRRRA